MTQTITDEFLKLDKIDLDVALWLYAEYPGQLYCYLNFISETAYKRKGIKLDGEKIFNELNNVNRPAIQYSLVSAQRNVYSFANS